MKELASKCKRSTVTKEYDKMSAAQHQLEGAIANLFLGNWPAAITLAAAAEGILPIHDQHVDLLSVARKTAPITYGVSEREVTDLLNELRDWLKHHQIDNPGLKSKQTISQEDAVTMVMRAYTRFHAHSLPVDSNEILSEHLAVFEEWFRENYSDWLTNRNKPSGVTQ